MIIALHCPDGVALFTESLSGIGSYAGIDHYRHIVKSENESSHIVVVMTLVIESALGGQKCTAAAHIAELCLRIPREVGILELALFLVQQRPKAERFEADI